MIELISPYGHTADFDDLVMVNIHINSWHVLEVKDLMMSHERWKRIGICAHSYEGAALCFLAACREGARLLGPHMHPDIIMSNIPMALSMPAWKSGKHSEVGKHLSNGVKDVAKSGADFFICPDNTAHIVLEEIVDNLPIPGLHIADVVCQEILDNHWKKVGLLGTKWTMTGTVYSRAFLKNGLEKIVPDEPVQAKIDNAIFDELCQSVFKPETIAYFINTIEALKNKGAECVVLGCTEIPLIINSENSPLPILDSTRSLAKQAVKLALLDTELDGNGWISPV